jgi:DNA-binding MarR family transcriptional regulator
VSKQDLKLYTLNTGIGLLLRDAYRLFGRDLHPRFSKYGITHAQFMHLAALHREKELTSTEISERVGVKKSSSTTIINSLRERELIQQYPHPDDKRRSYLALTLTGQKIVKKLLSSSAETNAIARSGLSKSEIETFYRVIDKIVWNFKNNARNGRH